MSGGYIDSQKKLDHQVVIFTFKGAISGDLVAEWNSAIVDLKHQFGELVTGVTIKGQTTKQTHLKTKKTRLKTARRRRRGKR